MKYISSSNNQEIKNIIKLHQKKGRQKQQRFIIEGYRAIQTAINSLSLIKLYTIENFNKIEHFVKKELMVEVSDLVMKKISTSKSPSGILGIFEIPKQPPIDQLSQGLVLAQVSDPGNMGTLIRSAAACNLKTVVVIEGTDPWSPKVVHSSAGTIALVNIFILDWQTLVDFKRKLKLYGLVVSGGSSIKSIKPDNALLIVGSESTGIPINWQNQCDKLISLPMPGNIESFNVAIAGSIALYLTFVKN